MQPEATSARLAVVVIGRNEGERLLRCLDAAQGQAGWLVYVDSGSEDGSVAAARQRGAEVVELNASEPYTAARARNAGFARAAERVPELEFVQFVDGDCELSAAWLEAGLRFLDAHPEAAAVAGRLRERRPEASPYNRLADMEWDLPAGESGEVGGNAMYRAALLGRVGGFAADMIAGEEPELCARLRRAGGRIYRIDQEMALHDADLERFGQWWQRQVRAGHAYAERFWRQRGDPVARPLRQLLSIGFWGGALPVACAGGALWLTPGCLLGLLAYGVLYARLYRSRERDRGLGAWAGVVGKFAQCAGLLRYTRSRLLGRPTGLIEYKQKG